MSLLYTAKMKHARRSKFGGVESYKNYGPWLKNVSKQSQHLYLDGVGLTRSKMLRLYFNISWCVHKKGEFTKYATLSQNGLHRSSVNGVETS